jgi:ElaB/YqjD/DUF883 family membrane-anchored ribosome-binding protein
MATKTSGNGGSDLLRSVMAATEATNRLVDAKFDHIRDSLSEIHKQIDELKRESMDQTAANRSAIEQNRAENDRRYMELAKKIWVLVGVGAAVNLFVALLAAGTIKL